MRIVLAGASGLIGPALHERLRGQGHHVKTLVRHATNDDDQDSWDPAQGLIDPGFLADADAVVCLSGFGVGERRWNERVRNRIVQSRVDSVGTIARSLAEYGGPRVLVAASAVGYYGDGGEAELDESAPSGSTFLAGVCRGWEAAADPARDTGVRVAHLRSGLALSPSGGMLGRLRPIVRAGIAGRLGSGRQFMPWISLADEVAAIGFVLEHD
ncbi:MAG: epimerase, partial [Jatrophihabitantaceae bacterium]